MAIKEWSTSYPTAQDPDAFTNMPSLVNGADDTRVSQIHTLRAKVHEVAKQVGDNSAPPLPSGCLKARMNTVETSAGNAIHGNVTGELNALTEKDPPVSADLLIIEDSEAGFAKKKVEVGNLPGGGGGTDADAIHDNVAAEISPLTEKVAPANGDLVIVEDSAAAFAKKKVKLGHQPFVRLKGGSQPANATDTGFVYTRTVEGDTELYYEDNEGNESQLTQDGESIGTDVAAYHSNVSGEISTTPEKTTPVGADMLVIEDSAAGNAKKRVQITNLPGGADADAIHDNVAGEIAAVTEKTTPVGADMVLIEDSADSNNKKRVQLANLPGGGGGGVGRQLSFSDDTEFEETGTSYVTKKTFRIIRDSDEAPVAWRLVCTLWTVGGTSAECKLQADGGGTPDEATVSSVATTEAGGVKAIDLTINATNEPVDTLIDINIQIKQTGGGTAHIRYTDLYAVYS